MKQIMLLTVAISAIAGCSNLKQYAENYEDCQPEAVKTYETIEYIDKSGVVHQLKHYDGAGYVTKDGYVQSNQRPAGKCIIIKKPSEPSRVVVFTEPDHDPRRPHHEEPHPHHPHHPHHPPQGPEGSASSSSPSGSTAVAAIGGGSVSSSPTSGVELNNVTEASAAAAGPSGSFSGAAVGGVTVSAGPSGTSISFE